MGPAFSPELKAAHAAMDAAVKQFRDFTVRAENMWLGLVVRCHVPKKQFYAIWKSGDAEELGSLLRRHEVTIYRDYPHNDDLGREVHQVRVFKGGREIARRSFAYSFNVAKGALEVAYF